MNTQAIKLTSVQQQNNTSNYIGRRKIYLALFGLLMRGTVENFVNVATLFFAGQKYEFMQTAIDTIAVLMFIYGLTELISKTGYFVIFSTFFSGIVWIVSGIFNPENVNYMKDSAAQFFIYVLPFMWIGYYLIREKIYITDYLKICRLKLFFAVITQVIIFIKPSTDIFNNDYMDSANAILVGLIAVYYLAVTDKRLIDIVLSISGTIVIMISGSRGVFLSLIFFWFLYMLFNKSSKKILVIFIMIVATALIIAFGNAIMNFIAEISKSIGFSTHLIDAIQSNSIFDDSTRTYLFKNFWQAIRQKPLLGYGVLGDRYISLNFFNKPIYPHNIILEVLVNFGFLIGLPLIIAFAVRVWKALVCCNISVYSTVLVLLSSCIIKLMVSSTFWNDQVFFLLIGVLLAPDLYSAERET